MVKKQARELPPAISVLLESVPAGTEDPKLLRNAITKGTLFEDLKSQAEWSIENWDYPERKSFAARGDLALAPAGSMNPLSPVGKCETFTCRLKTARDVARSLGLYSDKILIQDDITPALAFSKGKSPGLVEFLSTSAAVIAELNPLIAAGVIEFVSPELACLKCQEMVVGKSLAPLVDEVLRQSKISVETDGRRHALSVDSPLLATAAGDVMARYVLTKRELETIESSPRGRDRSKLLNSILRKKLFLGLTRDGLYLLGELTVAQQSRAAIAAGTRYETLLLSELTGDGAKYDQLDHWESRRTVRLPWVSDLSVEQVVRLREECGIAVERLRERLATRLIDGERKGHQVVQEAVAELREEAEEVKAELATNARKRFEGSRVSIGVAGLGMIVYGLASGAAPAVAAMGAVLTSVATVDHDHAERKRRIRTAKTKPGYVLLKARELLGHAE